MFLNPADTGGMPQEEFLASYETALPLVKAILNGRPLNLAERTYVRRFYSSYACKEFSCRLKIPIERIPKCWLYGIPSAEQCDRCELCRRVAYSTVGTLVTSSTLPKGHLVALEAETLKNGLLDLFWLPVEEPKRTQLIGKFQSLSSVPKCTSLEKVFTVCLTKVQSTIKGTCNQQCASCPAMGFYDNEKKLIVAGNGSVVIDEIKPTLQAKLLKLLPKQ